MDKEQKIEELKEILKKYLASKKNNENENKIELSNAVYQLLKYIEELEKNQNIFTGSVECNISDESMKIFNELFKPLRDVSNRFEKGEETLDDLIYYCPNFKVQFNRNGIEQEFNFVEKKYYDKLSDTIKEQNDLIYILVKYISDKDGIDKESLKKLLKENFWKGI